MPLDAAGSEGASTPVIDTEEQQTPTPNTVVVDESLLTSPSPGPSPSPSPAKVPDSTPQ
jgi:hypothetical protein